MSTLRYENSYVVLFLFSYNTNLEVIPVEKPRRHRTYWWRHFSVALLLLPY